MTCIFRPRVTETTREQKNACIHLAVKLELQRILKKTASTREVNKKNIKYNVKEWIQLA
jgi:hypothetical protein